MRSDSRDWRNAALVVGTCLGFVIVEWILAGQMPEGGVAITGQNPPAETKALDILLTLNATFLTYAVALVGGIGFFLKGAIKKEFALDENEWRLMVAAGSLSLLSIFSGHLVPYFSSVMLSNQVLDLKSGAVVWPMRLQYLFLALAGCSFLLAALQAANRVRKARRSDE